MWVERTPRRVVGSRRRAQRLARLGSWLPRLAAARRSAMADLSQQPPASAETPARCAFCRGDGPLKDSHLIPKFVYRFMRRTSPGLIRMVDSPNQLHQDGLTLPLLCGDCEGLFSTWESPFAREIFLPLHENKIEGVPMFSYGPWALKFAASVSWRTLQLHRIKSEGGHLRHLSPDQDALLRRAEEVWVRFMNGDLPHPGEFEQHIYPLDTLESGPVARLPPVINRYLLRSVDTDVIAAPDTVFVYTKMLRLMVIGFVQIPDLRDWHGGKLHVRKGILGTRRYRLPGAMMGYMSRRAGLTATAMQALSPRQRERTRQVITNNLDRLVGSEVLRAMDADVRLFGDDAFRATGDHDEGEDHS
jgi:hypothetical protein